MSFITRSMSKMEDQLRDAAKRGDVDKVRRLVGLRGVDPNSCNRFNRTPLHLASRHGCLGVVRYLIEEAHCDMDRTDSFGSTALHEAIYGNHLPIVQYLLETAGGSNVEQKKNEWTPLHCASKAGFTDIVMYLVEIHQADVNAKDGCGDTPLDLAFWSHTETVDTIRFLLPRTSSVGKLSLKKCWENDEIADMRLMVLEKYAMGRGLANMFCNYPIHTLLLEFPLPSVRAFRESIKLFPRSVLSLEDQEGRLPIHVALAAASNHYSGSKPYPSIIVFLLNSLYKSTSPQKKLSNVDTEVVKSDVEPSPSVVGCLFEREPRSALTRDPTTGFYPHESAAILVSKKNGDSNYDDDDDCSWLDVVYKMFRSSPQELLRDGFS